MNILNFSSEICKIQIHRNMLHAVHEVELKNVCFVLLLDCCIHFAKALFLNAVKTRPGMILPSPCLVVSGGVLWIESIKIYFCLIIPPCKISCLNEPLSANKDEIYAATVGQN